VAYIAKQEKGNKIEMVQACDVKRRCERLTVLELGEVIDRLKNN